MPGSLPSGWRETALGKVASIGFSGVDKKIVSTEQPVHLCNYTDVYYNRRISTRLKFQPGSARPREVEACQLRAGDVLVTKDSEDPGDIAVPALVTENMPGVLCGYHLAIIRPRPSDLDGAYLTELLQHHPVRHYFSRLANGVTRFGLNAASLRSAKLLLPGVEEQGGIARCLRHWEHAHETTHSLLKAKRRWRRGLMQRLLTGQWRFPEFRGTKWRSVSIGECLQEVRRTRPLDPTTQYRLVSIRRRSGGFFDREPRLGAAIGYSSLEQLHAGDFVIARRQVLHGAMAMVPPEFAGAYVSNAYAVLVPTDPTVLHMPFFNFMSQLPQLYHMAFRCSYGVAIEKMFFRLDWFFKEHVHIPPILEEQERIANALSTADGEIERLRGLLLALRDQKRGLMQKLLTGQVRVPASMLKEAAHA
jgi:type I restriction enzyme S subunit